MAEVALRQAKKPFVEDLVGAAFVGLMAVVNLMLRSDFRWPLLGLASLWAAAVLLAAFGV